MGGFSATGGVFMMLLMGLMGGHLSVPALILALVGSFLPALLIIAAVWYGWRALMQFPKARIVVDCTKISLPWLGQVFRKIATSNFCSALSMLYGAGVPLHEALVVSGEASNNAAISDSITRCAPDVMEGKSIAAIMRASGEFPALAVDMMAVGEKAGRVEESIDKVAEYLAAESTEAGGKSAMTVSIVAYLFIALLILIALAQRIGVFAGLVAGAAGGLR